MLGQAEKEADDLLYQHFRSDGPSGLNNVRIQLIDPCSATVIYPDEDCCTDSKYPGDLVT